MEEKSAVTTVIYPVNLHTNSMLIAVHKGE